MNNKKEKISDKMKKAALMLEQTGDAKTLLIQNKLEQLFVKELEHREERKGLHASSIIASDNDFCFREQVLSFFYKKNEVKLPVGLLKIFAAGESIHEKWQRLFVKHGLAKACDIECRKHVKELDLYMTPDAKIVLNDKKIIVEIKSMNTFQFKNAKTHPSGAKQCKFYLYFHQDYDHGIVLMEDKNTQEIKIQYIERDDESIEPYIERLLKIKRYKRRFEKEKIAPKRKCKTINSKKAQDCPLRDACFGVNREKLK